MGKIVQILNVVLIYLFIYYFASGPQRSTSTSTGGPGLGPIGDDDGPIESPGIGLVGGAATSPQQAGRTRNTRSSMQAKTPTATPLSGPDFMLVGVS